MNLKDRKRYVHLGLFKRKPIKKIYKCICDVQSSRLVHDIPITVKDNLPFCKGFFSQNFAGVKFHENKSLAKITELTVT